MNSDKSTLTGDFKQAQATDYFLNKILMTRTITDRIMIPITVQNQIPLPTDPLISFIILFLERYFADYLPKCAVRILEFSA